MRFFGLNFGSFGGAGPENTKIEPIVEVVAQPAPQEARETIPVSADANAFFAFFGIDANKLPIVTIDEALKVPAVWAAVSFLSRTLATLPLNAYRRTKDGPKRITGKLGSVIGSAPNPTMSSFKFRQHFWQQVFTGGRGLSYIERGSRDVESFWSIDPSETTITRSGPTLTYKVGNQAYRAEDIIDIPFMLKPDGFSHFGPIDKASKAIQLALSMNDYASGFFAGGGVPPLALTGPMPSGPEAYKRAMNDISQSIDLARQSDKPIFGMPPGHELKPIGFDPEKGQMTDARRFQIEEIARTYQMPPVFLQDLTHGTYTNTEQQGSILVKHLIGQWAAALEGEMNLKIFGPDNRDRYIAHDLNGLMRGDFTARMDGYSKAIQNAILTPDEARGKEDLPALEHGDKLLIQGATVPLGTQAIGAKPEPSAPDENDEETSNA